MDRPENPRLSFIVPVYNAAGTIGPLLEQINRVAAAGTEIVLIDDASTDESRDLIRAAAARQDNIVPLFHAINAGAGSGRNAGFAAARGRYAMFLDADDVFHPDAVHAPLRMMEQDRDIDAAIFQYRYTDGIDRTYQGMSYADERIFGTILAGRGETVTTIAASPELVRVTNYPWNKIIRTSRYRDIGPLFGTTRVHNDILAHWHVLLNARKILVSGSRVCTHVVPVDGGNITNAMSEKRLDLFVALEQTYALLDGFPSLKRRCAPHFWDLAIVLSSWAEARIRADLKPRFQEARRRLIGAMDLEDLLALRRQGHHAVADRIVDAFSRKG